jgi:hypothetical protein
MRRKSSLVAAATPVVASIGPNPLGAPPQPGLTAESNKRYKAACEFLTSKGAASKLATLLHTLNALPTAIAELAPFEREAEALRHAGMLSSVVVDRIVTWALAQRAGVLQKSV